MFRLYHRWIDRWETRLATRDTDRIVRPFDWGSEWLDGFVPDDDPAVAMAEYTRRLCENSDRFFSYEPVRDYRLDGERLTFSTPVPSPYPENNVVHARFFPAGEDRERAVLVLPQWNSDAEGHIGLCKLLNRFGISALRMSMAYHDWRKPKGCARADYHVSSNIGRTIHATRQSVTDARACLDWLEQQGYRKLAILGTSLGSCVSFLTAAHDERIQLGVFNHVSTYVSDVVWTGLSTRHVRAGLEPVVSQDELRRYWAPISPATYLHRLQQRNLHSLLVWAKYDTTFLPEYSRQVMRFFHEHSLRHKVLTLPCAHYTTGQFPFKYLDGFGMCRFLSREWQ